MKKVLCTLCSLLVIIGMSIPVYAGFEMMSEDQAKGVTDEMITGFKLGMNKSGQETSNGCTNNPMEPHQADLIEPLNLPNWDDYAYDYNDLVRTTSTSTTTPSDSYRPPYRQYDPNDPTNPPTDNPQPPATPEPATMLIMGLGLVALAPYARRKRQNGKMVD